MNGTANIELGDVLEWAKTYDGPPFHALLCDPPYHLTSIVQRFKEQEPEHTKTAQDIKHRRTPHARQAAGFMGKAWDGGDIAFQPETWAALGQHLHPGAFVMAFAGTRGYHRMACAIEDAGFIMHPLIIWCFGSGFPKATRIKGDSAWEGHRYGLQAMKPALECVAVAQKPFKGKPQDCIKRTGAGALNIAAGRIGTVERFNPPVGALDSYGSTRIEPLGVGTAVEGRWPANLCLDEVGAAVVDRQSGVSASRVGVPRGAASGDGWGMTATGAEYSDEGGASRFYLVSDWHAEVLEQLEECDRAFYVAKAGRAERDAGLQSFPLKDSGVWDGRASQSPSRCIGSAPVPQRNPHPTIKPLRLTKWLASLLLPPDTVSPRRLLIPFCGSGSEVCGALLAGWDEVTGIEMEAEYHAIAEARVKFWTGNVGLFDALTAEEDGTEAQEALPL